MSERQRVNMRARTSRLVRLVAVLAVVFGGWVAVAAATNGDESEGIELTAEFVDASPLIIGNDVQINGVRVGTIESMDTSNAGALLELSLDPEALPLYKDATLTVRPVSLLGEVFLDLDPGTPEAGELKDGAKLGTGQTASSTDLDEVLNALDRPTSQSLAALVTTLGTGLEGNGANVDEIVRALAPAMTDTQALAQVLQDQNTTLASLVDSLSPVAQGLAADDGAAIDQLVASATAALEVTATNEQSFRLLLNQLPTTLQAAVDTLTELDGTATAAVPTLTAIQPLTSDLTAVSQELNGFLDAVEPALDDLNPVLERADELIAAALPVAQQLNAQAAGITSVAASLDPLTEDLGGDFTTVMEFFRGWALATNSKDGLAHYFRAGLVVTPYSVTGLLPSLDGTRPVTTFDPGVDEPNAAAPVDPANPDSLALLPGLLSPVTTPEGGVTGLNQTQERGLLSLLLGGLS